MKTLISVNNISKTFVSQAGKHVRIQALDHVSLDIREGEILGVLGPNGAGKTTLLNILSTLLLPDSGTVTMLGKQLVPAHYSELRQSFNMCSGHPNFPWSLTLEENLFFYGRLYNLRGRILKQRVASLIDMFGLGQAARLRFDELSSGTKQKLALAKCLINNPKIIFLDEPTVGFDPDVAVKIRRLILDIYEKTGATILLTTHYMPEAEKMCQRIAFLKEGRLIRLATPDELKARQGKKDLEDVFIDLAGKTEEPITASPPQPEATEVLIRREMRVGPRSLAGDAAKWLNSCFAFTYRNMLYAIRNFFAFMELVFWPIVSLISIGLMGDFLQMEERALAFVITGAMTAGILQVTQLDVAYSLLYEVWAKSLKHTFLTPVGISEHLFGSWVIGIVRGVIIFGILGCAAMGFFGFHFPPLSVTGIFLLGIFGSALLLGTLVCYLLLYFGQKAEITAWMFAYLFMLVCGIYYPINTLPKFFYYCAQGIPITYFLEYFRQSFGFEPVLRHVLWKGFTLIIVYLVVGLVFMKRAFMQARKNGVIIKLSE
ncbi:MAG TPA: ABC transporter ATP-binding protein/permease [Candidatus Omnitrophota bacterium]|nr:ABC transporter ATP-binding protein/permease [Candidatus Omnitrophota bacterium]HPB68566.1 ABC transporter ATP-binding protein/permease [Candidatus Omnitrophota bacterium]HQO57835.1 ABC transporter ATP-binding protein/permease [Candidatus Omnitrophota bacterium]